MNFKRCLFLVIAILFSINFISAAPDDSLHLTIQTRTAGGSIESGSFSFTFNISTDSNCNNVLFSNTTTITTDSRGIISYYLENVNLDYTEQYYLCYYRDGTLKSNSKLARVPYAFNSKFLGGYNASFFAPLNTSLIGDFTFNGTTSFNGNTNFNGDWQSGGLSIINGDIYAQTVFAVNLTGLNVSNLNINGSFLPQDGFDNTFDLGSSSLSWRDLWIGRNVDISGDLIVDSNTLFIDSTNNRVGIGTTNPTQKLEINGSLNVTGNITIGDKITFRLDEIIDNIINGVIRITGNLNITDTLILNPQLSPTTSTEGGVFYNSSLQTLMVYNGTQWDGVSGVPSGAIIGFEGACPTGWTEFMAGQGRYFVGLPSGSSNIGTTVGTVLSDLENRAVGQHNHGGTLFASSTHTHTSAAHSHSLSKAGGAASRAFGSVIRFKTTNLGPTFSAEDKSSVTGSSGLLNTASTPLLGNTDSRTPGATGAPSATTAIPNDGNVAGTNAPYIQLRFCKKV